LRRFTVIALAAIVTGVFVGVVIAGSGGDDSGSRTHSVPDLAPPPGSIKDEPGSGTTGEKGTTGDSTRTAPTQTQTQTTPSQPNGGAGTPPSDTEQHDVPPPKGSPAQRFEEFCKQNPGAC
jgi:hypothetical protein